MENENICIDGLELVGKKREIIEYKVTNGTLKKLKVALREATKDNIFLSGTDKIKKLFLEDITDFVIGFKKTTFFYEEPDKDDPQTKKREKKKTAETHQYDIEYVSVDYEHKEFYEMDLTTHDYRHLVEPFLRAIQQIGGLEVLEQVE